MLAALYSMAYTVKFMLKSAGRTEFVVPPLEALWWAEDVGAFHANKRDEWQWTMMIMQPEQVMQSDLAPALDQLEGTRGRNPTTGYALPLWRRGAPSK